MARAGAFRPVAIRRALLRWFAQHARSLPWRQTNDPYAIWVSEVMLQQTQVATVIPFYRRFLSLFPTAKRLARAPLEQVLELWSGLGYYGRARQLHEAAKILCRRFEGRFPKDIQQARSLPGIGEYTARAVLSIAYNSPYPALDGNVARVVGRLLALKGGLSQPNFRRSVERELDRLVSRRQPGKFNQAVMELGQTICRPRAPRCLACPLRAWCRGYQIGSPESYPAPRPRRATEFRYLATAIIRRGGKVAMVRGLDEGLLGELWNFPAAFGHSRAEALNRLKEKLNRITSGSVHFGRPMAEIHHGITYRSIRVHLYPAKFPLNIRRNAFRWFSLSHLDRIAISQLGRKTAAQLMDALSTDGLRHNAPVPINAYPLPSGRSS